MLVDIARLAERFNMHLTSRGLPSDSTCILEAEPGKLDIKRQELGILFISLQVDSLYVSIEFRVNLMSLSSSFKKCIVMMT